jgi:hypothetical protein
MELFISTIMPNWMENYCRRFILLYKRQWVPNLTRLNSDGSLDMSFDTGTGGANDTVKAIAYSRVEKLSLQANSIIITAHK